MPLRPAIAIALLLAAPLAAQTPAPALSRPLPWALGARFTPHHLIVGWFEAGGIPQAAGATETSLLLFGVGLLPIAVLVGISYALWAGLCAAFIAFVPQPEVRDRLGVFGERDSG